MRLRSRPLSSEPLVAGEQARVGAEHLGQGDVGGVVGGDLVPQLPDPEDEGLVRIADEAGPGEIGDRFGGTTGRYDATEHELAQDIEGLGLDQGGGVERLVLSPGQLAVEQGPRLRAIQQHVYENARVDDDHRLSRSSRTISAARDGPSYDPRS